MTSSHACLTLDLHEEWSEEVLLLGRRHRIHGTRNDGTVQRSPPAEQGARGCASELEGVCVCRPSVAQQASDGGRRASAYTDLPVRSRVGYLGREKRAVGGLEYYREHNKTIDTVWVRLRTASDGAALLFAYACPLRAVWPVALAACFGHPFPVVQRAPSQRAVLRRRAEAEAPSQSSQKYTPATLREGSNMGGSAVRPMEEGSRAIGGGYSNYAR